MHLQARTRRTMSAAKKLPPAFNHHPRRPIRGVGYGGRLDGDSVLLLLPLDKARFSSLAELLCLFDPNIDPNAGERW